MLSAFLCVMSHLWKKCLLHQKTLVLPRRLVEDADLQAAKDLFGDYLDLDKMQPKSAKDFEDLARALATKYLHPHSRRCGVSRQSAGVLPLVQTASGT